MMSSAPAGHLENPRAVKPVNKGYLLASLLIYVQRPRVGATVNPPVPRETVYDSAR
jgi:hypothetical protein